MSASPVGPIRSWKKSPRVRVVPERPRFVAPPHWLPMIDWMPPRRIGCSDATTGGVNVTLFACAFSVCVRYRLHGPGAASGPPFTQACGPPFGSTCAPVPYHAMSTRPSSPAAAHAKTLFASPVGTCTGVDQCVPSSVEYAYISEVSPATELLNMDACSQTA